MCRFLKKMVELVVVMATVTFCSASIFGDEKAESASEWPATLDVSVLQLVENEHDSVDAVRSVHFRKPSKQSFEGAKSVLRQRKAAFMTTYEKRLGEELAEVPTLPQALFRRPSKHLLRKVRFEKSTASTTIRGQKTIATVEIQEEVSIVTLFGVIVGEKLNLIKLLNGYDLQKICKSKGRYLMDVPDVGHVLIGRSVDGHFEVHSFFPSPNRLRKVLKVCDGTDKMSYVATGKLLPRVIGLDAEQLWLRTSDNEWLIMD